MLQHMSRGVICANIFHKILTLMGGASIRLKHFARLHFLTGAGEPAVKRVQQSKKRQNNRLANHESHCPIDGITITIDWSSLVEVFRNHYIYIDPRIVLSFDV